MLIAQDTGVERITSSLASNGDVLALTANSAVSQESFNAQDIYVDGNHIGEIGAVLSNAKIWSGRRACPLRQLTSSQNDLEGPIFSVGFIAIWESLVTDPWKSGAPSTLSWIALEEQRC